MVKPRSQRPFWVLKPEAWNRHALNDISLPQLLREIAAHDLFSSRVSFSTQRGQALDIAAKFLLVEFRGRIAETKRANLDRLVEDGLRADADIDDFRRAADRVLARLPVMEQIFVEKDPLLSTQGPLVPYYWLTRVVPESRYDSIRPFLLAFYRARQLNRQRAKNTTRRPRIDAELARYDRLSRSINDVRSIEGRIEILEQRLGEFLKTGKVRPRLSLEIG